MATNVGALYVTLGVQNLYSSALNQAANQFKALNTAISSYGLNANNVLKTSTNMTVGLDNMSRSLKSFGTNAQQAGRALMPMSVALIAVAKYSTDLAKDFEAAMIRLTTIAGVTKDEIAGVREHILKLAPEVGVGPLALADAMYTVSSTMTNTTVALQVLDIAAKSTTVGLGDAKDMAKALTATILSYGTASMTAARAADALTQTIKEGGAEAKELAPRLVDVVPMAAMLGVSIEEVGANIATFTKLGAPAADAVVTLSGVLTAMMKPTHRQTAALKELGMSLADLRVRLQKQGLASTLSYLTNEFEKMGVKGQEGLARIFGRVQALRNVLAVSSQQSQAMYLGVLMRIQAGEGTFDRAFREMKESQVYTWGVFKAQLESVALAFGEALLPAFKAVLISSQDLLKSIQELADEFANLDSSIQKKIVYFAVFLALLGPITYAIGSIARAAKFLIIPLKIIPPIIEAISYAMAGLGFKDIMTYFFPTLTKVATAIIAFLGTFAGFVTAIGILIAALAYVIYTNWDAIKETFSSAGESIGKFWKSFIANTQIAVTGLYNVLSGVFSKIWNIIKGFITSIATFPFLMNNIIGSVVKGIISQFSQIRISDAFLKDLSIIKNTVYSVFSWIGSTVSSIWTEMVAVVKTGTSLIISAIIDFAKFAGKPFIALWELTKLFTKIIWTEMVAVVKTGTNAIISVIVDFAKLIGSPFVALWESAKLLTTIIWTEIVAVVKTGVGFVIDAISILLEYVSAPFVAVWELSKKLIEITWTEFTAVISTGINLIKKGLDSLGGFVSKVVDYIGNKLENAIGLWQKFKDGTKDAVNAIIEKLGELPGEISETGNAIEEWVEDQKKSWEDLGSDIGKALGGISNEMNAIKPAIWKFLDDLAGKLLGIIAIIKSMPGIPGIPGFGTYGGSGKKESVFTIPPTKVDGNLPQLDLTGFGISEEMKKYFASINKTIEEENNYLHDKAIPNFRKAVEEFGKITLKGNDIQKAQQLEKALDPLKDSFIELGKSVDPSAASLAISILNSKLMELTEHTQDTDVSTKTTSEQFQRLADAFRIAKENIPNFDALTKQYPQIHGLMQYFKEIPKGMESFGKTLEEQRRETEAYAKEIQKLRDTLTGADADKDLKQLTEAYHGLTKAQQANPRVVEALVESYDKLRPKITKVSDEFEKLRISVSKPIKLNEAEQKKVLDAIEKYRDATQASGFGAMPSAKDIAEQAKLNEFAVKNFIEGLKEKNEAVFKYNEEHVKAVQKSNEDIEALMADIKESQIRSNGDMYETKIAQVNEWAVKEKNKLDFVKLGWDQYWLHLVVITAAAQAKINAIEETRKAAHQEVLEQLYDMDDKYISDIYSLWEEYAADVLKTTLNSGMARLRAIQSQYTKEETALRLTLRRQTDWIREQNRIGKLSAEEAARWIIKIEDDAIKVSEILLSKKKLAEYEARIDVLVEGLGRFSKKLSEVARIAGDAWKIIGNTEIKEFRINPKTGLEEAVPVVSGVQKWVAGLEAASAIVNTFVTGTDKASMAVRGLVSGMATGASIGYMFGNVIGAGVGAAVGAVMGLVSAWQAAAAAEDAANEAATTQIYELNRKVIEFYSLIDDRPIGSQTSPWNDKQINPGIDALLRADAVAKQLKVDLGGLHNFGIMTPEELEKYAIALDELDKKLKNIDDSLKKYNLTWKDLNGELKEFYGKKIGSDLVNDFNNLINAGVDVDKVVKGMSVSVSDYIVQSIQAGVKIPAAMEPIIKKMIELGTLSDEAARAMLGLEIPDDTMPSLEEITAAAGRYGLTLDALGPKVKQLSINESAKQIVADFNTLIAAGADVNVILSSMTEGTKGMGEQVQELVNQALKYGLELPSSMKPILEAMIAAGLLTDETGQKMTDLSKLTFAADLTKMFEQLMTKLGELIDKIGGVSSAVENIPTNVTVDVHGVYYPPDIPGEDYSTPPQQYAGGGVVYAAGGWAPRGSDTVPAMLTPGERVLTVAESRNYGRPIEITVISKLDGREIARNNIRYTPNELALSGL